MRTADTPTSPLSTPPPIAMLTLRKPSLTVRGAPPLSEVSRKEAFLVNDDLKPVTPAMRTWKARNYVSFWVADGE